MKRTFVLNLTGLLFVLFVFTRCTNPSDHHQHPRGIAYYKMNLIPFPFLFDELKMTQLPYMLTATIKDSAIIGHKIYLIPRGEDSVKIRFTTMKGSVAYTRHLTDDLSNDYFTLYLMMYPVPYDPSISYAFEFLEPEAPSR